MITKVNNRLILFLVFFLAINGFVVYFIRQERYLYFWDFSFYWSQYQHLRELFAVHPAQAFKTLWYSIRYEDHNLLAVFLLTPFNFHLFGNERLAYISSVVNVFAVPSVVSFVLLIEHVSRKLYGKISLVVPFLATAAIVLLPQFWIPVLTGYYDVVGVFVISVILLLSLKEPLEKQKLSNVLLIGFLLSLLVLLRRYYAFWVVSFILAVGIEGLLSTFFERRFALKHYVLSLRNVVILAASSFLIFFSVATPVAEVMLSTNYADIYSAYKISGSTGQLLKGMYKYFGLFTLLLFLLGCVWSLRNKETRKFSLLLVVQVFVVTVLFSRTQDFYSQHYYLVIPSMLFVISMFVINAFFRFKKIYQPILLIGYVVLVLINFSVVFIPGASPHVGKLAFLFPNIRHYPMVQNDLGEIVRLRDTLEKLSVNGDELVYVLSSTSILNDDILRNSCLSEKERTAVCKRILTSHHVDKRDGFPMQFLTARYVIITDPIQYHLLPEDQRVIGIISDELLNQKGIGSSYRKLGYHFTLDHNVKVYIYEKVTAFRKSDLTDLSQRFIHHYPDKKNMFEINTICHLISRREVGDGFGMVECQKDFIYLIPGPNKPSTVSLKLDRKFRELKMVFAFDNPEKIPASCGDKAGEVNLTVRSDGKTILQKYVDFKQPVNYRLDVGAIDVLEITADKGKYGPECDWFMLKNIQVD